MAPIKGLDTLLDAVARLARKRSGTCACSWSAVTPTSRRAATRRSLRAAHRAAGAGRLGRFVGPQPQERAARSTTSRPTSPCCPRTTNRSGWWRSRRWPAAARSSPRAWAGSSRPCATASPGSWCPTATSGALAERIETLARRPRASLAPGPRGGALGGPAPLAVRGRGGLPEYAVARVARADRPHLDAGRCHECRPPGHPAACYTAAAVGTLLESRISRRSSRRAAAWCAPSTTSRGTSTRARPSRSWVSRAAARA